MTLHIFRGEQPPKILCFLKDVELVELAEMAEMVEMAEMAETV